MAVRAVEEPLPDWLSRPSIGDLPVRLPDMDAIIELITEGHYDAHLEDLLAAAHGRKRERRGLRHPYGTPRSPR